MSKEDLRTHAQEQAAMLATAPPQVEPDGNPDALTDMERLKLAIGNPSITMSQVMHAEDDDVTTDNSGVAVTHTRMKYVRIYKPSGEARRVPVSNLERLLDPRDGRCTLRCPRCGTDCGGSVWGCGKVDRPRYYECPVQRCNAEGGGHPKRFYIQVFTPLQAQARDENRLEIPGLDPEKANSGEQEALARLYAHCWAKHPDVAAANNFPKAQEG